MPLLNIMQSCYAITYPQRTFKFRVRPETEQDRNMFGLTIFERKKLGAVKKSLTLQCVLKESGQNEFILFLILFISMPNRAILYPFLL